MDPVRAKLLKLLIRPGTQPLYGQTNDVTLNPDPILPEWIESGSPQARSLRLSASDDMRVQSGLWECTAGTFRWVFACDEIVHILDGEVEIEFDGQVQRLVAGSVAHFPWGVSTRWRVTDHVKKFWVQHHPHRVARLLKNRRW